MPNGFRRCALIVVCALLSVINAHAQTLRIGLAEDPDVLDPTLARSFVGRIVLAALCDKLFDIDEKLNIVPQLAASSEWSADSKALTIRLRPDVTFHDGERLDAAAVKYSLERHKTMAGSNRRGELAPLATVDVVDAATVRLNLTAPFSPLLAQLADRAGMIVSPKAAQAAGDKFGAKPVCAGPFKFVERVAQDRIVLERYANYWNKGDVHFDRVVFLPIPDSIPSRRPEHSAVTPAETTAQRPASTLMTVVTAVGIMLVAANLRPAVVTVAPLIDSISADQGFSGAMAGLLTTLPVLFFGVTAPVAPRLAARFGIERTIFGSLILLVAAILLRYVPNTAALFVGSALIGAAIGIGNVLLPALIKRDFAHRSGLMTGLYS